MRLSICIPTYNRRAMLQELLESIVAQASDGVEIVISDNASTDGTDAMVREYQERFANIVYVRSPENLGADRNYLSSVKAARGEYCWLMGSDDVLAPDAVARVLRRLPLGQDVFILGFTLCTIDMVPIVPHRIVNATEDQVFDLSDRASRLRYLRLAETTTALFSYLSSIVVKRARWNEAGTDESYIGTLWVHSAQILRMLPGGLTLRHLPESFLNKRGGNDSFVDRGIVNRIGIAVDGYHRIADEFFGEGSEEAFHIRRLVKNEIAFIDLVIMKLWAREHGGPGDGERLAALVDKLYLDGSPADHARRLVFHASPPGGLLVLRTVLRAARGLVAKAAH